ncbi:MAG TPA: GAF domain-containing protein, partial [Candidatus Binatia bacterium]|nr:GAF domain-containing protein [Candidatus Binatia bacterium]
MGRWRSLLSVPLRQQGEFIGSLGARRTEVRPFTPAQIKLLETFADQAVIAIENVRLFRELKESLEQQTATSEILGVIASSSTDIQPVLDAVAASAARLCDATDAVIMRRDGDTRTVARYGSIPLARPLGEIFPDTRGTPVGRAMVDRQTIHVHDIAAELDSEFRDSRDRHMATGSRTILATPLLREGACIGAIMIRRTEVRPFVEKQIKLLETFADQAVIAIENARLFQELTHKTADLETANSELRESLEQQTATSEILGVIASSPTDIQPVLDVVAENAARLCDAKDAVIRRIDGDRLRVVAIYGPMPTAAIETPITGREPVGRAIIDRQTIHVHDVAAEFKEVPESPHRITGTRTLLITPLLREGVPIGVINVRRTEVRPFTEKQIALLETFANQAVIAIENVRLFKEIQERNAELREALEHQTATAEVLGIISRSPTDVQPVFEAIARSAAELCEAEISAVYRYDGELIHVVANTLRSKEQRDAFEQLYPIPAGRGTPVARAILERRTQHVPDTAGDPEYLAAVASTGFRSALAVPMLRDTAPIGAIAVGRMEVREFTDAQIKLLEMFADQAIIAIENVRLFQELQERTSELARSVGELKALGEVGQAVSSTLELETVLTRIASHAVQLSGADGGAIYEYEESTQEFHLRGSHQIEKELVEALRSSPIQLGWGAVGQAATTRAPIEVTDILDEQQYPVTRFRPMLRQLGYRSLLAVPLLREDRIMGGLTIYRRRAGSFSTEVVNLLQTFATQSVLAI